MARTLEEQRKRNADYMREWSRRKYASDPAYRERILVQRRAEGKVYRARMSPAVKAAKTARAQAAHKARLSTCPAYWALSRIRAFKSKCAKGGIPFNIDVSDLVIPDVCPVLQIPLVLGAGVNAPNLPSVDRIRGELGYVKGNVRVISYRANLLKSDDTFDEHRLVYEDALRVLK